MPPKVKRFLRDSRVRQSALSDARQRHATLALVLAAAIAV
jgi:hypothetical protein